MKKLFAILMIISFSCNHGISKEDEDYIKNAIAIHNGGYGLRFTTDSLKYYNDFVMINAGKGEIMARHISDSLIKYMYKNHNVPYSPEFDANLTYDKFIRYCNENQISPRRRAEMLLAISK